MTGNNYLLDTNIISAWLENDYAIADKIDKAASVYMCVIVVGEMYFGAQYSAKIEYNIRNISKALAQYPLLTINEVTCIQYGKIKASLRRKGNPIPENDIWIAAIAIQYNLTVSTRDQHFKVIDGLTIEEW